MEQTESKQPAAERNTEGNDEYTSEFQDITDYNWGTHSSDIASPFQTMKSKGSPDKHSNAQTQLPRGPSISVSQVS